MCVRTCIYVRYAVRTILFANLLEIATDFSMAIQNELRKAMFMKAKEKNEMFEKEKSMKIKKK